MDKHAKMMTRVRATRSAARSLDQADFGPWHEWHPPQAVAGLPRWTCSLGPRGEAKSPGTEAPSRPGHAVRAAGVRTRV